MDIAIIGLGRMGAIDLDVPAPIITLVLQQRFISRQDENYAAKLLAPMRNQFGAHELKKE